LLRLLAADLAPTGGAVLFPGLGAQGPRQSWPKVRARIAFVEPQPPRIRERLEPALVWTAVAHGMDYGQAEEGARVTLHRFGLAAHAHKRATELSTGLRLRFEIARILMTNPDLIILDEPLANLDVVAQQALLFDLQMLAASVQQPRSILISSQHINEIEAIADRVIVLSQGQSLFVGRKDEIAVKLGVNVFEVVSENRRNLVQTARALGALEVIELGVSVVLVVPQAVSREALLAQLSAASVDVTGFYDLSRSAKALLYIDRLVSDGRIAATVNA
jgi:ABC-2 type transport system ATP-binding protein